MQTKLTAKRLLAVVMAVLMMLAAIPFSSVAADEATPDYIVIGSYNNTPIRWQVLKTNADGSMLLISENVIAKVKFGGKDFATSTIYTTLNTDFYNAAFSETEKAALVDMTITYTSDISTSATATGKVVLPTKADVEAYALTKTPLLGGTSNTAYWLADWSKTTTICTVTVSGTIGQTGNTQATPGYRPMITVKADSIVKFTAVDGASYTSTDGKAITYALAGSAFKVVLAENYTDSVITVKADGTAVEAVDGVYTASASPITVEGVEPNAADYTEYDAAVASTADLVEDDYSVETWAALQEALNADVADLSFLDQDKVDAATKAINDAVAALAPAPADFTAYQKALDDAQYRLDNPAIFYLDAEAEGIYTFKTKFEQAIRASATILTYTKLQQALVDAAAEELAGYVANVPYMMAVNTAWKKCVDDAAKITADKYEAAYVAAVQAIVAEVVAEHDYVNDPVTALYQADVDAATKRMRDVIGEQAYIDSQLLRADFSALEEALVRAATYVEGNYYKDEDVDRDEEKGGTNAWSQFAAMKERAEAVLTSKENNPSKISYQTEIDTAVTNLVAAMDDLDQYIKLDGWDRFVKDVKYFFSDIQYQFQGFIDLMKTVFGLLGMLFRGEIDLYGLFEMLDVGQDVLDFLIMIGITPKDYVEPELPEAPETPAA